MIPARFVKKRGASWRELEEILNRIEYRPDRLLDSGEILRFSRLYREVCTDLSLANAYNLPRETRDALENLVARGHGNLYARPGSRWADIREFLFRRVPYIVYKDMYVRVCTLFFFVPFFLCALFAFESRKFAVQVAGEFTLFQYERMHSGERNAQDDAGAALSGTGYYIWNNVALNLLAFGMGALGGVGSLLIALFNAVYLGTIIGYLLSSPARDNIITWIAAHGPFELCAIGISAGAGLRIGYAFIAPEGRERLRAVMEEARFAVPVIFAGGILTACAAFLEGFIGPSSLELKYRAVIAALSFAFLIAYFIINGMLLDRSGYRPRASGQRRLSEAIREQASEHERREYERRENAAATRGTHAN